MFDLNTCTDWFSQYLLDDDEIQTKTMGPAGIEKLCQELGISIVGVEVLELAFYLNATEMGYLKVTP